MSRIWLTEDNDDQRHLYHDVLTDAGYEVVDASSAAEALELVSRGKYDAIVTDVQMPGMDGIQLMHEIRSKHGTIPVILHTAHCQYKDVCASWMADAFVEKSGHPTELVEKILDLILAFRSCVLFAVIAGLTARWQLGHSIVQMFGQ